MRVYSPRTLVVGLFINILLILIYVNREALTKNRSRFVIVADEVFINPDSADSDELTSDSNDMEARFDLIYKLQLWGRAGGGSGRGSSPNNTVQCRNILYNVIVTFNITSIIDAPCGAMAWIPDLLVNISGFRRSFRYLGVDVAKRVIDAAVVKFADTPLRFALFDITRQTLPAHYDMIFCRDTLQHLSYERIIDALEHFAQTPDVRYLLVSSYLQTGTNKNISVGQYYPINLSAPPFRLNGHLAAYPENDPDRKHLVLYDIPNYLRRVNFAEIREELMKVSHMD